ncbi:Na+/H+ antiporter NhaC family protein [Crassaminicella profunda]|uniref:Na+/H+ antiporter NhaC family protein n=1 Tax=Crassaminicella profunda TaxID=1286698 RepID=UPI001CA68279|nr:Na+/H+ antiporter NhaC family protein [Crassaminicella profunda]QZY54763.1 hypothetical protein K7H06_17275 [Crassaminicella profunda]
MKKKIDNKLTYLGLSILLFGILLSLSLGYSALYGILFGILAIYMIAFFHGYPHKELFSMMFTGIKSAWVVLLIMSIVGMLIGVWMISGTIPTMMYMGFKYLSNLNFVLTAFLISSIISMVLGTSLGTISTVGLSLIGIGKGLHIPLPLLVGAIVSGSYVGDRSSPMSSSANLTAAITKTKLIDNIKHMMNTLTPVYLFCMVFYYLMGKNYLSCGKVNHEVIHLQNLLSSNFHISFILLIPPLLIVWMAIFRFSMIKSLSIGLLSSFILIIYHTQFSFSEIIYAAFIGFHPKNIAISAILSGGGLISMKNVILIITASTALNGILDGSGMIGPLVEKFMNKVKNVGDLILRTSFLSFIVDLTTCNQTLSIIIPGKFLQSLFEEKGISKNTLARTISDTGIILVPLIPWNANAIVISSIFNVPVLQFVPFALLCYLLPIITVIYGYLGFVKKNVHA